MESKLLLRNLLESLKPMLFPQTTKQTILLKYMISGVG